MELTTAIMKLLKFVGSMYCPKRVNVTNISDLQLYLICKQLAESNKLRPTLGALEEHIKHVRVRCQVTIMQQQPFNLLKFGFYKGRCGQIPPVTTTVLPAPQAFIEFIRWCCETNCHLHLSTGPNTQSFTWIPHSYTLQMP